MSDLLSTGLAWLETQRTRFMAKSVIYRRPGGVGVPALDVVVLATVGKTTFEVVTAGGVLDRVESRDYLIAADALTAIGLPQRGDRVIEDVGGARHTAEVLAPGREPHWRWSDITRASFRIHTKHLTTEPHP